MNPRGPACGAWELLLEISRVCRAPAVAEEVGLSEAQAEVLRLLDAPEGSPMCRVADRLGCDPSNVTGIVDRLEARGLVERHADERDRRVKNLVLTPAGRELRERLAEPPPLLRALSADDQERLFEILSKALRKI
ncbi:MAG: MarR family winged helix-turn-helix transcriptional regulator [Candidatus Binatia bacterium]